MISSDGGDQQMCEWRHSKHNHPHTLTFPPTGLSRPDWRSWLTYSTQKRSNGLASGTMIYSGNFDAGHPPPPPLIHSRISRPQFSRSRTYKCKYNVTNEQGAMATTVSRGNSPALISNPEYPKFFTSQLIDPQTPASCSHCLFSF